MTEPICKGCRGSLRGYGANVAERICFSCSERRKEAEPTSEEHALVRDTALYSSLVGVAATETPTSSTPPTTCRGRETFGEWFRPLHARYLAGDIQPHDVPLPFDRIPATASPLMGVIAQHMQACMGLALLEDWDKPVPYAYSMAVRFCGARNADAAGRAIELLVKHGVVERGPDWRRMPGRAYPTRTYRAPAANVLPIRRAA